MPATENKSIRFALAGYGRIGLKHRQVLEAHPQCELVAVIDCEEKQVPVPFFSTISEFAAAGVPADVITIATPNGLHARHAVEALKAGYHVVVEKPLALCKADAEAVFAAAAQKQKQAFVVMQNRLSPVSAWLKHTVSSGVLGKIFLVQVNCFWNRSTAYYKESKWHGSAAMDGGTLFTQFSHFIDLLYWLFGDITHISSRLRNFSHAGVTEFEDSGLVSFDFVNGGIGSFQFSTAAWQKNLESSVTILAENGTIKVGGQYMERIDYCNVNNGPTPHPLNTDTRDNHYLFIDDVVRSLHSASPNAAVPSDAIAVVDIIERIYTSSKTNIETC